MCDACPMVRFTETPSSELVIILAVAKPPPPSPTGPPLPPERESERVQSSQAVAFRMLRTAKSCQFPVPRTERSGQLVASPSPRPVPEPPGFSPGPGPCPPPVPGPLRPTALPHLPSWRALRRGSITTARKAWRSPTAMVCASFLAQCRTWRNMRCRRSAPSTQRRARWMVGSPFGLTS